MVYKFEFVPDDFIRTNNISKGEKIINVKGTPKRKAHKRVIITRDLDRLGDKKLSYKSSHDFIKNEIGFKIDMRENDKYTKDPLLGEQIIVINSKGNKLNVWIKETPDMIQLSTIGAQEKGTGIGTKYLLGLKKYADISGKKLVIPNMTPNGKKYFSRFDWLRDDTVKLEWEEKGKHKEYYPENTMSYMANKDKGIVSTDYKESIKNMNNYITNLNQTDEGKKILYDVNNYTMNDYKHLNNYMKDPASLDTSIYNIDRLEKLIINIKKFISDAPKYEGRVYRGLQYHTNDPESKIRWESFIKNIKGSKEMKFGSFISTSSEKMVGVNFATKQHFRSNMKSVLITIKTKSGISIQNISQVESEHEVLLNNDKTYKIISFSKQDDRNHFLELQEL